MADMRCTVATHEALKLNPAAYAAATVPIAGFLKELVDDDADDVRVNLYCGANCLVCGSTLFVLFASVSA